jgi:hypothetical protein
LLALFVSNPTPSWHRDYGQALTQASTAQKPVAVFIGTGAEGWKAVCENGELSLEVRLLLAQHYVCVYVDANQSGQQSVVQSFEATRFPLLVLSTRNGTYQAYRHSGKLAHANLAQALQRHATQDSWEYDEPATTHPAATVFNDSFSFAAPCRT